MPTMRIADPPEDHGYDCPDPDHGVPANISTYAPGVYVHTCPTCACKTTVIVPAP